MFSLRPEWGKPLYPVVPDGFICLCVVSLGCRPVAHDWDLVDLTVIGGQ
jgi:hypothetical protein